MTLYELFSNNNGREASKWSQYFPAYERHFAKFINHSVVFLEIGVRFGGSLPLWRKYFGPNSVIVGVDIDKECKCVEDKSQNIFVEIGSQSDPEFIKRIAKKYGTPHIVIDDGSHMSKDMNISFDCLFPMMPSNGVYALEDTHTCYIDAYNRGVDSTGIFTNRTKTFIDQIHSDSAFAKGRNNTANDMMSMHIYDSLIIFEKAKFQNKSQLVTGSNSKEEYQRLNPKLRRKGSYSTNS